MMMPPLLLPQARDDLEGPLREMHLSPDSIGGGGIGLPEFRRLLSARLQDPLDLFEARLAQPAAAQSQAETCCEARPAMDPSQELGRGQPAAAAAAAAGTKRGEGGGGA